MRMRTRIQTQVPQPRTTGDLAASGLLLSTLVAVLGLAAAAPAAQTLTADGVVHVTNPATPSQGVEIVDVEQLWHVGGEDDEDVLFGIINQVLIDDDNNIYLLDAQLSEVKIFTPEGELDRTIGRAGSGPGEINGPADMVFMPNGTLGLVQVFPGKIVTIDLEGAPAGDFNPNLGDATQGGFLALVNCRQAGGTLVLSGISISMNTETLVQDRTYFVRSYDAEQNQIAEYHTMQSEWNFADNFVFREIDSDFIWTRIAVGSEGKVFIGIPRYEYAVTVYTPDGTLERVFEREFETWSRNETAMARFTSLLEAQAVQFPPGTEIEVEQEDQDIQSIQIRRDGTIWIMNSRQMWEPEAGFFAFDVFSPAGEYIKEVKIRCDGRPANDRIFFAGDDLVFLVTGFWDAVASAQGGAAEAEEEPEPMAVTCFRAK